MLKLIIEKELREIVESAKFVVTFAVCSVLILLTFYVGARNYQVSQEKYEAAKSENLRQMQGLTGWMQVNSSRIFLPPNPLEALVTGVSNDIGRTIEMAGRGELTAHDSRYNDEPIFAVFRFLDLDFIFQIILSLFAILFAYHAINGEKERGTLRLAFANSLPRDKYILAKLIGAFLGLGVPLLIPILLGCLLLPLLGIHFSADEWLKLMLVFVAGFLFFGVFLTLSVFISAMTHRSTNSFIILLVIWVFSVLIIPKTSVLLAGRAVDVPSVDEISSQKARLRAQLWKEDRDKMGSFKPSKSDDPESLMQEFNKLMQELADNRDKKLQELAARLNEDRRNRQTQQERLAFGLARISPAAAFSLAATRLVGTSLDIKENFLHAATGYQKTYAEFMKEKTGMNLGGNIIMIRARRDGEEEKEKAIDPKELPEFQYTQPELKKTVSRALFDFGILGMFNVVFFAGAYSAFLRYDVR